MSAINQTPTFNLKVATQETGIKPSTLRAWERRYGLPDPQRSAGGHRLYSQRDIDMLKWLLARQEEGLSISRAVDLWRRIEAEDQDPLQTPGYGTSEMAAAPPAFIPQGDATAELRQAWVSACLAFDEQSAEQILAQAFALYPPGTVCFELLQKGLAHMGEGWYRGEITIQQEHFASRLAMRRLETLVAAAPAPTRPGRILVGCAPEDEHAFVSLLLTFLLKRSGWTVVDLGARVPAAHMEATVAAIQPDLVVLAAQQLYTAASLLEVSQLLHREQVPLAYGGRIFNLLPALRHRIPGHFLGERLESVPQVVEQLLTSLPPLPPIEAVSETYRQALAHYCARQIPLEADVWQSVKSLEISPAHLPLANQELARDIIAALTLGDMSFLSTNVAWAEDLLVNQRRPTESLHHYLNAYYQAAQTHLNKRGNPIVTWLAQLDSKDAKRHTS